MRIFNYILNIKNYLKNGGFRQGGVTYVKVNSFKEEELLKNKNIIITEGSNIVSCAVVRQCISMGGNVLVIDKDEEKLKMVVNLFHNNCKYLKCNISEIKQIENVILRILEIFDGHIDILINNTRIGKNETFNDILLKKTYFFTQHVYRQMVQQNSGNIMMVSAAASNIIAEMTYHDNYCTMLGNFVCGLAKEGVKYGIRCNSVLLQYAVSPFDMDFQQCKCLEENNIDDKNWYYAKQIAEVICFLISDSSVCVNGQILACDEGNILK